MTIENLEVYGFGPAIRGMRNSFASWDNSDSVPYYKYTEANDPNTESSNNLYTDYHVGPEDMKLMKKLYKAGGSERKFMRMIQVWVDISAPLTWWKQFDTYKVGTTALSTSTMHSITDRPFTIYDFHTGYSDQLKNTVDFLNDRREAYNKAKEERNGIDRDFAWREIIDNLPESYIQKRTVNMNYEVIAHMINDRKNHKLHEWHEFCEYMLLECPYLRTIMDVRS